ncbi:sensor histidine kinase [Aequorivita lipolytica]|uniref:histidine kinase n=1 Tax=Aequorivita lipolytica TaxID=153267 RepID=A0A5C6YNG6_9FLAO|nr:tetratricopeptide repeat-containing sensor histidine kinase [Aequorivita lipolytica]TXD68951.1 tetratricopeptide repeat protein [Aequorivita lipolytica]SRX53075.1 Sensor histidine kinase ComP [Aequorivita lipolytica]
MIGQYQIDSTNYHYNHILNPQYSSDIPLAINYYTRSKENHLKAKNTYGAIKDLRMIAIGQFEIGNSFDSETATVEALRLIDNASHTDTLVEARKGLYNQLGRIYRATQRYDEAIKAYGNALQFSANQNDSLTILNNIGNLYKDMGRYEKALERFELALAKKDVQKNPISYARLLDNKGDIQAKLDHPEALPNLELALKLRERENDMPGKYSSYRSLALYYFDKNDTTMALDFANQAYEVAKTMNSLTYLENALWLFVSMSPDPKIVRFEKISDSIEKEKQLAENKNAFMKYNVEKERKNTVAAQLEKERQKTWTIFILAIALLGLVLTILFYFIIRAKHKQENITQVYTTEKRISKKVHDEVANDVYKLMAKLQSKPAGKDEILDDLESIYNKSRDISKENSAVDVENFNEVLSDLLMGYQNEDVSVIRRNAATIDWDVVPDIKKTNIYRVIQELMTNMAKHSNATAVVLNFDQKGKAITIKYADNGKGCVLKNKNGLQNAESRIAAIKGTITFESEPNKGFKATIII